VTCTELLHIESLLSKESKSLMQPLKCSVCSYSFTHLFFVKPVSVSLGFWWQHSCRGTCRCSNSGGLKVEFQSSKLSIMSHDLNEEQLLNGTSGETILSTAVSKVKNELENLNINLKRSI